MLKTLIFTNAVANLITCFEYINLLSDVQNINSKEFPNYRKFNYYLKTVPREMHNIKLGNPFIISKQIMDSALDSSLTNTTSDSFSITSTTEQNNTQSSSITTVEIFTEQTSSSQLYTETDSKLSSLSTTNAAAAAAAGSESTPAACLEIQTISTTVSTTPTTATSVFGGESIKPKMENFENNTQIIKIGKITCPICHTQLLLNLEII